MRRALFPLLLAALSLAGCADLAEVFRDRPLGEGAPYGAAAFSDSTRKWAVVSDHPSAAAAAEQAVADCDAADCRVVLAFDRGSCASLSLDAERAVDDVFFAASTAASRVGSLAQGACTLAGGRDCLSSPAVCN